MRRKSSLRCTHSKKRKPSRLRMERPGRELLAELPPGPGRDRQSPVRTAELPARAERKFERASRPGQGAVRLAQIRIRVARRTPPRVVAVVVFVAEEIQHVGAHVDAHPIGDRKLSRKRDVELAERLLRDLIEVTPIPTV